METPKPHPFAALIRAWADGATVQFRPVQISPNSPSLLKEWKDLPVISECGDAAPMFNTRRFEYRIKPEDTKPWRPKEGESFWLVGYDGDIYQSDALPNLNRKVIDIGNCFPASIKGHEEAEAAAERFKAILKDVEIVNTNANSAIDLIVLNARNRVLERENVSLKEDLKSLQTRCKNLHKAKEALIASHAAIDGVTLTAGEIALIRALRAARICRFFKDFVIVEKHDNGVATHRVSLAFFTQYPSDDAKIKDAIEAIKKEQEGRNGNA